MKTKTPSRKLTLEDAIEIWRLWREGELQSRIAARFDVNQGRVSEVVNGKAFPEAFLRLGKR
jgi:predicted XRE-type DNA-binding protein